MPVCPALRERVPCLYFLAEAPTPLANLLGHREDFRAESFRVLDHDPRAVVYNGAIGGPLFVLLFELGRSRARCRSPFPDSPRRTVHAPFNAHGSPSVGHSQS